MWGVSTMKNNYNKLIVLNSIMAGKMPFASLLLFSVLGAVIAGITPLIFGKSLNQMLVDNGEIAISFSAIRMLLFLCIVALILQGISTITKKIYNRAFFLYWVPIMITKVSTAKYDVLTKLDTGNLNRRITKELDTLSVLFNEHIGNVLKSVIVLIFAIYMLVRMSVMLTGIIIAGIIIIVPIGIILMKVIKKLMKKVVEIWSLYEGATTDYIASQYQIRSYKAESRMIEYIKSRLKKAIQIDLSNAVKYMAIMLLYICFIMILLIGFLKHIENSPSVSKLQASSIVVFLGYLWIVVSRITTISSLYGKIQKCVVVMDRMHEFFQIPDSNTRITKRTSDNEKLKDIKKLVVDKLSVSIDNKLVIDKLSFSAKRGDVVLFKGRSGCGKTTLIRSLFGFCEPSCGRIFVNNIEVPNLGNIGDNVVMLPQEIRLLSGSFKWNIEILTGREIEESELVRLLNILGLERRISGDIINKLDIKETGSNLSGGEKQRLALAAILLRKPDIVLLDEPTAHVDDGSEKIIIDLIESIAISGGIVLVTSHSTAFSGITTKVITLDPI